MKRFLQRFMNCYDCGGDIGTARTCIWCAASQDISYE